MDCSKSAGGAGARGNTEGRESALALMAVGALLGVVAIGGDGKHVVALNADAVYQGFVGGRGVGVMLRFGFLRFAHSAIVPAKRRRTSSGAQASLFKDELFLAPADAAARVAANPHGQTDEIAERQKHHARPHRAIAEDSPADGIRDGHA